MYKKRGLLKLKVRTEALDVVRIGELHQVRAVHHDECPSQRVPQVERHVPLLAAAMQRQRAKHMLPKGKERTEGSDAIGLEGEEGH